MRDPFKAKAKRMSARNLLKTLADLRFFIAMGVGLVVFVALMPNRQEPGEWGFLGLLVWGAAFSGAVCAYGCALALKFFAGSTRSIGESEFYESTQ
jgi:hypothetical protein